MSEHCQGASPKSPLLLEFWKPVKGFEIYYEISNVGNVCRVKPYRGVKAYQKVNQWSYKGNGGRPYVVLSGGGKRKSYKVHKMMVDSFWGGTPVGLTVNHEDGDYTRNRLSNFSFMTDLENKRHAAALGLMPRGEHSNNAKITAGQAFEILSLKGKMSLSRISEKYGISTTAVRYIWQGRNWAHVKKPAGMLPYSKSILKGDELPQAILNAEKVKEIMSQKGKANPKDLAKQYGISYWTVYKVWSGKSWKHVA